MLKMTGTVIFSVVLGAISIPSYAVEDNCAIEVAVASPPIKTTENVAFNITSEGGVSRSVTLSGGSAPKLLDKLPCREMMPYTISATRYQHKPDALSEGGELSGAPIGQCQLKAGTVLLIKPGSSVSVVFPNDFTCAL